MIVYEDYDYELKYNLYLAEKEYYSDLDKIMNSMIMNEETTLGFVTESLKDAVEKYITKVTASTQNVWNKFKGKINKGKDLAYLKKIRPTILKFKDDADFYVDNYPEYNIASLTNLKLVPLNYQQMKENLNSREAFMNAYYKNINFQNKVSVKKAVREFLTSNINTRFRVSKQFLVDKFNFNSKQYYNILKSLENDMEALNRSNDGIVKLAGSIMPTEESINFRSVYESLLLEAPINPMNMKGSNKKISFSDANGNKLSPNKKVTSDKYLKRINVYMDCMAGIVTGKMTVLMSEYQNNMSILTMAYNRSGGGVVVTDRNGQPKVNVKV